MKASVAKLLGDMSKDELRELNQAVVARIRHLSQEEVLDMRYTLGVGAKVHFPDKMGRNINGTVTKFNIKTVAIHAEDGRNWRVHPSYIKEGHV